MSTAEQPTSVIGKPQRRIDGPVKVSGRAMYTSDHNFPGMLYAVPVGATIAKGRILELRTASAERMPGVRMVYHHRNIGKLYQTAPDPTYTAYVDEQRPPFRDEEINYYGQYVAVVIADSLEHATAAADAIEVVYHSELSSLDPRLLATTSLEAGSHRGDPQSAFASAPAQIDHVYVTPTETHAAIELHATVAVWNGKSVTLYDTVQGVCNHRNVMTQMLGVEKEDVRVIMKYLGSGFGGKTGAWTHCCLAAVAARDLNRPVKLVITRKQAFEAAGHRPRTEQRLRLGATPDGKLLSLQHDYSNTTSMLDKFVENCGEATPYLYSTQNLGISSGVTKRTVGAPTWMRGPGAVPGLFALESAMDEMATKLRMDPIAFRQANEPKMDESLNIPFSSRHLTECMEVGAARFGWSQRTPQVGSMKRDGLRLGWGVAACSWIAARFGATASVEFRADGTARVACGTQDIGTGTYTVLAQIVSEQLSIPLDRVEVALGDTSLPPGPLSGGSAVTASLVPAVYRAVAEAAGLLTATAARTGDARFATTKPADMVFTRGRVHRKDQSPESGMFFGDVLTQANQSGVRGQGRSESTFSAEKPKFSMHCFGAQFAEVTWQPEIARLRVSRIVTVVDAGRIINPKAARNQIEGAVVMGVGMALFEETNYDSRKGEPINSNLADYLVPTNADAPEIDVHFLDYPDYELNELGAKGVGEIGLAGVAPAIANAVYHATGVRVRELPIRIEDLL